MQMRRLLKHQKPSSYLNNKNQQKPVSSLSQDWYGVPPVSSPRRVVVTGLGLVTPLGVGVAKVWERLLAGHTGVCKLTAEQLPEVYTLLLLVLSA